MPNDFSAILPILQDEANIVGRELVGFIPASFRNTSAERAGHNQTINYPIVPTMEASPVTPSNVSPTGSNRTVATDTMVMDKLRRTDWHLTGEQQRALENGDIGPHEDIVRQTLRQAMRTLVNEIEYDLWQAAYKNASRAVSAAGTAPFNTVNDMSDLALARQVLNDNGAPAADRHCILSPAAYANFLSKQTVIFKANEAGSREPQSSGFLPRIYGFDIHESYPITLHTKGTASGATTDNAGYPAGATTLELAAAGTGTIIPGDIITIATENAGHNFVVTAGDSDVSNGGTISIGRPGLRAAIATATRDITVGDSYVPNIAMQRNGLHLIMRAPDDGGDSAVDRTVVQDETSGLVFQLAAYGQYMQRSWELRVLYGVKAANPHLIAIIRG